MLPESFLRCLDGFAQCFTAPTYKRFETIIAGWVLCVGKRTVTGVIRAAGVVGREHHSGYHRFFSQAAWNTDAIGLALMRLVLSVPGLGARVVLTIDDTLARHTGKHIAAGAMHRDPLLSCGGRPFFHFGHNWVVVAVVVAFPEWNKVFSLPVLMRLYRTEKLNKKLKRPHRKKTELASEMIAVVAEAFGSRRFLVVADNAYANRSILRPLPKSVDFLGRARMDASVYAPPPQRAARARGRPRVKGRRLASPAERAKRRRWRKVTTAIYGRQATVQVQVFDALWYVAAHARKLRFVLIRGWPGHDKDDVLVTTDLSMTANEVIHLYCNRWSIEETFGWVKSRLGFEDPQNRTERAVERTAPIALWTYSLVILWYARWSRRRRRLPFREAPWYTTKVSPSFADMLAQLRRHSWTLWISDQAAQGRLDQKGLAPLLDVVGYG